MTATDPWVQQLARRLALGTAWPAHTWADALATLTYDPDRNRWAGWLLHNPDCSPEMFLETHRVAQLHRHDAPGDPSIVTDLENLARRYRELNGLSPDAPLTIDLGPMAAAAIAEQAAAEAAEYLAATDEQP